MTVSLQDKVRDVLVAVTGFIPNETVSGLLFGVLLVTTDHVFNILPEVKL